MTTVRLTITPPVGDVHTQVTLDCIGEAWNFYQQLEGAGDYISGTINGATVQVRKDRIAMIEYLEDE